MLLFVNIHIIQVNQKQLTVEAFKIKSSSYLVLKFVKSNEKL